MKQPLKIGEEGRDSREVYLKLAESHSGVEALDSVQALFDYSNLDGYFSRLEKVTIEPIAEDSIEEMKSHSLTISYQTTNGLIYQAAAQRDVVVTEIVLSLICHCIEWSCFSEAAEDGDDEAASNDFAVMNEGTTFKMQANDLVKSLEAQIEKLVYGQE